MSEAQKQAANSANGERQAAIRNRFIQVLFTILIQGLTLFLSAGTLRWPAAWAYVGVYLAGVAINGAFLSRKDPDLVAERSRANPNAKAWDRILAPVMSVVGPLSILIVSGLDNRLDWTDRMPIWLPFLGGAALMLSFFGWAWAMSSNRFFSGLVAIQRDRDHTVATGGPYRIVRHPGYVSFIVMSVATPILLGSLVGLIPAGLASAAIVVRTALEDRTLQAELPGYREYAQRVRYRLLPPIW